MISLSASKIKGCTSVRVTLPSSLSPYSESHVFMILLLQMKIRRLSSWRGSQVWGLHIYEPFLSVTWLKYYWNWHWWYKWGKSKNSTFYYPLLTINWIFCYKFLALKYNTSARGKTWTSRVTDRFWMIPDQSFGSIGWSWNCVDRFWLL